jgi:hypothetical protein
VTVLRTVRKVAMKTRRYWDVAKIADEAVVLGAVLDPLSPDNIGCECGARYVVCECWTVTDGVLHSRISIHDSTVTTATLKFDQLHRKITFVQKLEILSEGEAVLKQRIHSTVDISRLKIDGKRRFPMPLYVVGFVSLMVAFPS